VGIDFRLDLNRCITFLLSTGRLNLRELGNTEHTLLQAVAYEREWYGYTHTEDETYSVIDWLTERRDGEARAQSREAGLRLL